MLLGYGALVNTQTIAGESALHLAAESGSESLLETLLYQPKISLDLRDNRGNTPFSKAVKSKSIFATRMLAPYRPERLSGAALEASKTARAKIRDFGTYPHGRRRLDVTMYELLCGSEFYANAGKVPMHPAFRVAPSKELRTDFRWIHIPTNRIEWAEALLTKAFVEDSNQDLEKFVAMERSFETLRRGQKFISHYMRPVCELTSDGILDKVEPNVVYGNGKVGSMFMVMPYVHFHRSPSSEAMQQTLQNAVMKDRGSAAIMIQTLHTLKGVDAQSTVVTRAHSVLSSPPSSASIGPRRKAVHAQLSLREIPTVSLNAHQGVLHYMVRSHQSGILLCLPMRSGWSVMDVDRE